MSTSTTGSIIEEIEQAWEEFLAEDETDNVSISTVVETFPENPDKARRHRRVALNVRFGKLGRKIKPSPTRRVVSRILIGDFVTVVAKRHIDPAARALNTTCVVQSAHAVA